MASEIVPRTLRQPPQPLPVLPTTPDSIIKNAVQIIKGRRHAQNKLVAEVGVDPAPFANAIHPLAHAENEILRDSRILEIYASVTEDLAMREASRKAINIFNNFRTEVAMRDD